MATFIDWKCAKNVDRNVATIHRAYPVENLAGNVATFFSGRKNLPLVLALDTLPNTKTHFTQIKCCHVATPLFASARVILPATFKCCQFLKNVAARISPPGGVMNENKQV